MKISTIMFFFFFYNRHVGPSSFFFSLVWEWAQESSKALIFMTTGPAQTTPSQIRAALSHVMLVDDVASIVTYTFNQDTYNAVLLSGPSPSCIYVCSLLC